MVPTTLSVHPAATIFPLLPEEELDALTADIAENGLQHPIIVQNGVLIDGRNRLEACRRAGVEPTFQELNGADPVAYILSSNIARRHLSKGQRAMAVAKLYPEAKRGGARTKGAKASSKIEDGYVATGYVSQARTVLRLTPTLADDVIAGTASLADAYAKAKQIEAEQDTEPRRLDKLREQAPDLADLVVEERMKLMEAEAAAAERRAAIRRRREGIVAFLSELERVYDVLDSESGRMGVIEVLRERAVLHSGADAVTLLTAWHRNLSSVLEGL